MRGRGKNWKSLFGNVEGSLEKPRKWLLGYGWTTNELVEVFCQLEWSTGTEGNNYRPLTDRHFQYRTTAPREKRNTEQKCLCACSNIAYVAIS